MRVSAPFEPRR